MTDRVVLVDPQAEGLPAMIAGLISAAVAEPAGAALLDRMRGTVTITLPDAEVSVGLHFAGGSVRVSAHPLTPSKLRLTMDSDRLLGLSSVPLLAGLPSVLTSAGRAVTLDMLTGKVRIAGLRHLTLLRQLTTLLSTA
ncbi:MAG: hypothetical protein ACYDAQ_02525 [Mycobacteriales bacterium]